MWMLLSGSAACFETMQIAKAAVTEDGNDCDGMMCVVHCANKLKCKILRGQSMVFTLGKLCLDT